MVSTILIMRSGVILLELLSDYKMELAAAILH